jgi:hypothetical protein
MRFYNLSLVINQSYSFGFWCTGMHCIHVPQYHRCAWVYYDRVSLIFSLLNLVFPHYFLIVSQCDTTKYGCVSH